MSGPPAGKVVARCDPSQAALLAGVVSVGRVTKPLTSSGWLVLVERIRPITDRGAVPACPVTARADETYTEPARSPSSEGSPTKLTSPCTGRKGDFCPAGRRA